MEELRQWAGPIGAMIAIAVTVWSWLTSGEKRVAADLVEHRKAQAERDKEVDDAIVGLASRLQAVEQEMRHLPDKDSVVGLQLAMAELKGTIGRLDESLGSVQRTVLRIDDYLRQDRT
jgi:hypothetical protein